jgi:hypothetical protein
MEPGPSHTTHIHLSIWLADNYSNQKGNLLARITGAEEKVGDCEQSFAPTNIKWIQKGHSLLVLFPIPTPRFPEDAYVTYRWTILLSFHSGIKMVWEMS